MKDALNILKVLKDWVFFYMGEVYIALVGEILTGAARGASLEGSVECRSGHTRTLCSVHTIVLLNCTIVRLYYCTCTLADLHYWTLLLLIAGYVLYCTVLLLHFTAVY